VSAANVFMTNEFLNQQEDLAAKGIYIYENKITILAVGGFVPNDDKENTLRLSTIRMINDFLAAMEDTNCSVGKSCRVSGISRNKAVALRNKIPEFDELWSSIYDTATDKIEDAAFKRAVTGITEAIYYQGELVDYKTVYSDSLLTLLLQSRRPEIYRQRQIVDDNKTGSLSFNIVMDKDAETPVAVSK
jgi:hypothetical protein